MDVIRPTGHWLIFSRRPSGPGDEGKFYSTTFTCKRGNEDVGGCLTEADIFFKAIGCGLVGMAMGGVFERNCVLNFSNFTENSQIYRNIDEKSF